MMISKSRICFVTNAAGWGGSEELWSRTALHLTAQGVPVAVSMPQWAPPHPISAKLVQSGAKLQQLTTQPNLMVRAYRKIISRGMNRSYRVVEVEKFLRVECPTLVVLSDGVVLPPVELMELCKENDWPFVTVGHQCPDHWWPDDQLADRLRVALPAARRAFFVCRRHQLLVEKRLDCELPNAEIVRNPFNVAFEAAPIFPQLENDDELRLACVGTLQPAGKAQDIVLEILSQPPWRARRWRLTLYGDGPQRNGLMRLSARLGIADRVVFAGHVSMIEKIWSENHALVLPSRHEGLPLVIVEAMLCGRPVVATDVGGIREIVQDGVTGFVADVPTVDSVRSALERLWTRRTELEQIGKAAAKSIRELVPANPAEVFANKLLQCAEAV